MKLNQFTTILQMKRGLATLMVVQALTFTNATAEPSSLQPPPLTTQTSLQTDVLVIGGGAGGVGAALGAARQGISVVVVEESPWLGGMITASGVAAFDGNRGNFTTGIYTELKQRIRDAYGPDFKSLCTVSDLCFEPHVGASVLDAWLAEYPNIKVYKNARVQSISKQGNKVTGATFTAEDGSLAQVSAAVTVDGTEFGDVLHEAGAAFRLGRDVTFATREPWAPLLNDGVVQDITYVAILKDYGPSVDKTISRPEGFDPNEFACAVATYCPQGKKDWRPVREEKDFWDYGRLPNNKFMLNWPTHGANVQPTLAMYDKETKAATFAEAKQRTLRFVYFIQTVLGHKSIGLAEDEFGTNDGLPFYPYVRESRRIVGDATLTSVDTIGPYARKERPLFQYSVAFINYTFDHHHTLQAYGYEKNPRPPAFGVALPCYIPKEIDGLMVVDKNISVTHVVNGATRLQPIAFSGGAAVGVTAAIAAKNDTEPRQVAVRQVQDILLSWGSTLIPFRDIAPNHPFFGAIQRSGLAGVMVGNWPMNPDPLKLPAFEPTLKVTVSEGALYLARALGLVASSPQGDGDQTDMRTLLATRGVQVPTDNTYMTFGLWRTWLQALSPTESVGVTEQLTNQVKQEAQYNSNQILTKADMAYLLDIYLDPFHRLPLPSIVEVTQ